MNYFILRLKNLYPSVVTLCMFSVITQTQAQHNMPGCEAYRNTDAANHKIKNIDVYDGTRKIKIATYEFDKEGYLLRLDTLMHNRDTFPSQRKYVRYANNRTLIIDSTINFSKDHADIPPTTLRVTTLHCNSGRRETSQLDSNLIDGNCRRTVFILDAEGRPDTIYRVFSGKKEIEFYFNHYQDYTSGITTFNKYSQVSQSLYATYEVDKTNKLLFYTNYYRKFYFAYNTAGLLTEESEFYGNAEYYYSKEGKKCDCHTFVYEYKKNKLYKRVPGRGNRTMKNGKFICETSGTGKATEYGYNSKGLLSKRGKLTFKYHFYKRQSDLKPA